MCIVLEVGKTYLNRLGEKVKVVSDEGSRNYPIIGVRLPVRSVQCFTRSGFYYFTATGDEHCKDLVRIAPTPHPHAESMMLYAQDAAECERPWLRWEFKPWMGRWEGVPGGSPVWDSSSFYRHKPQSEWPPEAC